MSIIDRLNAFERRNKIEIILVGIILLLVLIDLILAFGLAGDRPPETSDHPPLGQTK